MKLKYLLLSVLSVILLTVSCSKEEDMSIPSIRLETYEVAFGTTAATQTVEFMANRAWTATWDSDWIAVEPISGEASDKLQTITISVLNNAGYDRTGNVKITMTYDYKTIEVNQTGERGGATEQILFFNNFDKQAATQSYGTSGSSWPYLDQFDGWINESGVGIEGVTYGYKSMSCRNNSNSNGSYSDYPGSGTNNLLFASGGYFIVKDIKLTEGNSDYKLSFGTERYITGESDNTFKPSEFHVYISEDNDKWVELTYSFPNGYKNGRWDLASTTFTVPNGTTNLSIYFKSDIASGHRLDDVKLEAALTSGTAIDFSTGIELDGGGSGGGGGGGTDPADAIYSNNFDKEQAVNVSGAGWPFAHSSEIWKNEKGSGISTVTYESKGVTVRSNSTSDGSYSDYSGSGMNNMFFGTDNFLKIADITLGEDKKLTLTFGAEKYTQSDALFKASEFHIYVSEDKTKWVELSYTFPNGFKEGRWDLATTSFKLPDATTKLSFYIKADVASAYRLDDFTLAKADASVTATEIDFSKGTSLDGGGGSGGGDGTTYTYKKVTAITSGKAYLMVANSSKAAKPVTSSSGYGYLNGDDVTVSGDQITMNTNTDEFVFTIVPGSTNEYTIAQSDGKLLYMSGTYNNFNVAASPTGGQIWKVEIAASGEATITNVEMSKWIQWSGNYSSYGSYNSTQTNSALPVLYEKEGDGGSGGGGGGGGGGGDTGDYDVVITLGSGNQTWSGETDPTYGAGFAATASDVKIAYYKHTSTTNAVTANADHIRVYKNSVLVITPNNSAKKIKGVKIETTGANYCSNMNVLSDSSTATASGTTITWSSTAGVSQWIGHAVNAQVRIKTISIKYAD